MIKLPEGIGFTASELRKWPHIPGVEDNYECMAQYVNAKLPALFEEWVKREGVCVYLSQRYVAPKVYAKYWTEYENDLTLDGPVTHQASLVCVEELKK